MERRVEKRVEENCRVDFFLKKEIGLTEKQIRQAKFRENGICVNGEQCRITQDLTMGDMVSVLLEEEQEQRMVPAKGCLDILYEDEDLLIVNKPAGIVVHPSHGHYGDSILNLAAGYYEEMGKNVTLRVIGRLDKETSGVLVLAKNQIAAARLTEQKKQGIFIKEYLAIPSVFPVNTKGTIRKPLSKNPSFLNKMMTVEEGTEAALSAVTHYEMEAEHGLLHVKIETGRTHQIRVHMASIGCPLLGDTLYGSASALMNRTALHAQRVVFQHPFTKEILEIEAEIPEDFRKVLDGRKSLIPFL